MRYSATVSVIFVIALAALTARAAPVPSLNLPRPALRGGGSGRGTANVVVESIATIVKENAAGQAARSEFTKKTVNDLKAKNPKQNYVVVHTKHRAKFTGVEGKDWTKTHIDHRNGHTGTTGYEIYSFGAGEFWLEGDGGFLNWAYQGNVKSKDGGHLIFNKP